MYTGQAALPTCYACYVLANIEKRVSECFCCQYQQQPLSGWEYINEYSLNRSLLLEVHMKMIWALQEDQLLHANISMPSMGIYSTQFRVLHGVF